MKRKIAGERGESSKHVHVHLERDALHVFLEYISSDLQLLH